MHVYIYDFMLYTWYNIEHMTSQTIQYTSLVIITNNNNLSVLNQNRSIHPSNSLHIILRWRHENRIIRVILFITPFFGLRIGLLFLVVLCCCIRTISWRAIYVFMFPFWSNSCWRISQCNLLPSVWLGSLCWDLTLILGQL